jgi:transposase
MTTEAHQEAEIRRLHFAEHWKVGTISRQLSVHEDVVRRLAGLLSPKRIPAPVQPLLCGAYARFIEDTLERYPTLRATRLHDMLRARGFTGSVRTLREHVAEVRPRPKTKAYLRVESLPGEQAQVDWAHVGHLRIGDHDRAVWAFVLVLSWSRAMFAELVFDLTADSLCRSLVRAGQALGGFPRQWLFDNPKIVVLERHGDAVRFHPSLVALSDRLHVEPRLCPVRTPTSKGKVERSIRYLRDRFFDGRVLSSLEDGNRELRDFIPDSAHARPHPRLSPRTVADCFAEERARLLPLPAVLPATDRLQPARIDKTAFLQFDSNRYSVPWERAGQTLTLVANDLEVRVIDGEMEVATHLRRWGKREVIEHAEHRQGLVEHRRAAEGKGRDFLRQSVPRIDELGEAWVQAGRNVGNQTARTLRLLELYGAESLRDAVEELLNRSAHDLGALSHLCERRRREKQRPVPLALPLPSHARDRDVIPHDLEDYDAPV